MKSSSSPEPGGERPRCPKCGAEVDCGYRAGRDRCWCENLPRALAVPPDEATDCYCEACLRDAIADAGAASDRDPADG